MTSKTTSTFVYNPLSLPIYLMAKPAGADCNLNCSYCYYLDKGILYAHTKNHLMTDELLEKFTKDYINSQPTANILFTWHGGEPLLRNISFYKKAIALQQRYGRGRNIVNVLQTNGTLLNDEWCRFFKDQKFLIGISIDGPEHCHDIYRRNKGGMGTFLQVMQGIHLLQKHGVEFNTMSVINHYNAEYPLEVYHFLKEIGSQYMQLSPIVERQGVRADGLTLLSPNDKTNGGMTDWSVTPTQFGEFYTTIFDEWVLNDVGDYFVQLFDSTLATYVGVSPGVCIYAEKCGHAGAIEYNGDVYVCDHFVFPENKLGNIYNKSLLSMMLSPEAIEFGNKKQTTLPRQCQQCPYKKMCNGECPKNRIIKTKDGEDGLNYLCEGYKMYFQHVLPYIEYMANEYNHQRPPSNVINWARSRVHV